jgi:hypothetical protein
MPAGMKNTNGGAFYFEHAQLDLAYALYRQSRYLDAEKVLVRLIALPSLGTDFGFLRTKAEINSLLSLCYFHTNHPKLAEQKMLEAFNNVGSDINLFRKPLYLNVYLNRGELQDLEGRPMRAARYYNYGRLIAESLKLSSSVAAKEAKARLQRVN